MFHWSHEVVLCLCQYAVSLGGRRALFFRLPIAESLSFVVININRPIPLHVNLFKNCTEVILMRTSRPGRLPEEWPFHISVCSPSPPIITPIFLHAIAPVSNEVPKLPVRHHMFRGKKVRYVDFSFPILIVPSIAGEVSRLPKVDVVSTNRDHGVRRIVDAKFGVRRLRNSLGCRVELGPIFWSLDQMQRCFAEKNRAGLKMDSFVLKSHEQRPHGMVLVHRDALIAQRWVIFDRIDDGFVHLLPVLVNFRNHGPHHIILMHIVPEHFVDANFED
mmetsp:Transcript_29599/g.87737  ORF Transcript_29599/g.87737 Transcript_29599/m.87737 type:complete len:275 (+) Transcript_29599:1430-2254(+)